MSSFLVLDVIVAIYYMGQKTAPSCQSDLASPEQIAGPGYFQSKDGQVFKVLRELSL